MRALRTLTLTALLVILAGCKEKQQVTQAPAPPERVELPAGLALNEQPKGFIFVAAAYETLKAGDPVTIQGLVGGSDNPFNDKYAILTIANKTAEKVCCPSCQDEDIMKASIQVIDENGNVLKTSLKGFKGLSAEQKITVTGTVTSSYEKGQNMVINATGIYVHN